MTTYSKHNKGTCDRCPTLLNGQYMTHYGEALCDRCYDKVTEEAPARPRP